MITYLQAIILGCLQGITELFPISSLGHSVILPSLFGWKISQDSNFFLLFLVFTHLATSLVLFGFYFKEWMQIIKGIFRSLKMRAISQTDSFAKLGWLIIVASIPAGVLGLLFQDKLQALFASPRSASLFLIGNGLMLYGAEILRKRSSTTPEGKIDTSGEAMAHISWSQSVKIGLAQSLALLPGFSRTGATLAGGLAVKLNHEEAAHFAFLLATPILFGAALLKLPDLLSAGAAHQAGPIVVGALTAAIAALFSVIFLTKYFKTNTLKPFALYCLAFGILSLTIFLSR